MKSLVLILFVIFLIGNNTSFCQKVEIIEINENIQTEKNKEVFNEKKIKQNESIEGKVQNEKLKKQYIIHDDKSIELPKKEELEKEIEIVKVNENRKGLEDEK